MRDLYNDFVWYQKKCFDKKMINDQSPFGKRIKRKWLENSANMYVLLLQVSVIPKDLNYWVICAWTWILAEATFFFQFPSHLLPPTYVNSFSSFLQIKQLLLVPNLEQSGGTLSKSYKYKILWSETMVNVTNFTIPSLKVQNSFCSEHLHIIKY